MKIYKVVTRPSLLYGSETWVRDLTRLEAVEVCFLRSVKGYTRLDKIRSEIIRRELEIAGIQDVRTKYKKKIGSTILKERTTPDSRNTPSTTNPEDEEIVDAPGKDGNASMSEQVKRPYPLRKMMKIIQICVIAI